MQALPIDTLLPEIVASLRRSPNLVIEAAPGAGKTTRVPPALLLAGLADEGEVWVLEPRRLAARMAARRVAEERGEQVGETVGYQVRFEEVAGPRTRLRFLTEGVFTRRLLSDPLLSKVSAVVLDEFHERHLQGDLALAFLRRLQRTSRPLLRIIAMSATLDAAPVASFLGDCPELRSEGKRFDVSVEHLPRPDERPLEIQVLAAVRKLLSEGLDGDVLVFLPGAAEIRRAQAACAPLARESDFLVLPLHGELPAAEQDRAVRPADRRKLILSTNVAETSVTIDGVVAVIDSGLARVASHSPWSGLPTLTVARISKASAAQRAGRAGRTRAGRCLRLYTAQDFAARAQYETPEIKRSDLADTALELHGAGVAELESFEWFEPPPEASLAAAESLLLRLEARDEAGQVTEAGRRMLRLPLHPRLSRLVVEAERRGVKADACIVAALIGERDIRARQILQDGSDRQTRLSRVHGSSDLLELLDLFKEAESARFAPAVLQRMQLEPAAVRAVDRVRRQLARLTGGEPERRERADSPEAELLISILAGYPDRVAKRRSPSEETGSSGVELLLAGGGSAELAPESVVRSAQFMVAVDVQERREPGRASLRSGRTLVRLASAIEPEWLLDLFTDHIGETLEVKWDRERERVEVVERLSYDGLVLDERRAKEGVGVEVSRALAEAVLEKGWPSFIEGDLVDRFLSRVAFVAEAFPEAAIEVLHESDVRDALCLLCEGRRSFAEIREAVRSGELLRLLRARLSADQLRLLEKMAPERVTLSGSGRKVAVNYERAKPPWIASRLQDFFGMSDGPRVAGGRVPLVLHLLAPNQRPVQVTTDLSGFWQRHYPQARRELSRRYPRHAWPEEPLKKG
jgi:ATP-dependent helicase HrpB